MNVKISLKFLSKPRQKEENEIKKIFKKIINLYQMLGLLLRFILKNRAETEPSNESQMLRKTEQ